MPPIHILLVEGRPVDCSLSGQKSIFFGGVPLKKMDFCPEADYRVCEQPISTDLFSYESVIAYSLADAETCLSRHSFDVVIIDGTLDDPDIQTLLLTLNSRNIPAITFVPGGCEDRILQLMAWGAQDYLIRDSQNHYLKLLPIVIHRVLNIAQQGAQLRNLQMQAKRDRLMCNIALHIRQSLDLNDTLNAIVMDIHETLNVDRVIAYQFCLADGSGKVIAERVTEGWISLLGRTIRDDYFAKHLVEAYCNGRIQVSHNIYTDGLTDCHIRLLESIQVQAIVVVPVVCAAPTTVWGDGMHCTPSPQTTDTGTTRQLWGLLVAQQCSAPRTWQPEEVDMLQMLSLQMTIAIQQSELYKTALEELQYRCRIEQVLRESESHLRTIVTMTANGLVVVNGEGEIVLSNPAVEQMLGRELQQLIGLQIGIPGSEQPGVTQEIELLQPNRGYCIAEMQVAAIEWQGKPAYLISLVDITERKQTEARLQASLKALEDFKYALDQSSIVAITDTRGRITYANDKFCEISKYSRDELIGQQHCLIKSDFHSPTFFHHLWRTIVSGQVWHGEIKNRAKDGTPYWVDTTIVPFMNEQNIPYQYLAIRRDITARKQAEEALQESEVRFRATFEQAAVGMCHVSLEGRFLRLNQRFCEIVGYSLEEMRSLTFQQITPPDDLAADLRVVHQLLRGTVSTFSLQKCYIRRNRSMVWVNLTVSLLRDDTGRPHYFIGVIEDITDRKAVELERQEAIEALHHLNQELERRVKERTAELQQTNFWLQQVIAERQRLAAVVEHSPDLILMADPTGQIIYVNHAGLELVGLDHSVSMPDLSIVDFSFAADQAEQQPILETLTQGEPWQGEGYLRHFQSGTAIPVQIGAFPIKHPQTGAIIVLAAIVRNITDRKQAEEQLRNLSERLTLAVTSGGIGIWEWHILRNELIWDDRMYQLYGIQPSDVPYAYEGWLRMVHPGDRVEIETISNQALRGEREFNPEFRVIHPDGSIRYIQAHAFVQWNEQGEPQRMIGINYDITDRKQAETSLRESEARYRALMEGASDAILLADLRGNLLAVNRKAEELWGYSQQELTRLHVSQIHPPEELKRILDAFTEGIQNGAGQLLDTLIIREDGTTVPVDISCSIIEYGGKQFSQGIFRDITDRKRAELELRKNRDLLEAIFSESADALFLVDPNTYLITDCNYRAVELFEANCKDDLLNINGNTLQRYPFNEAELAVIIEEVLQKGFWSREIEYVTQKGTIFWANMASKKITVADQDTRLVRLTDITERKRAEIALQLQLEKEQFVNAELARATRLKDEFLANMSHELRTPLNAILGLSEGLSQEVFGQLNEKQKRYVSIIDRSGRHLLELINDILDLAKIEAGQLELELSSVCLNSLCDSCLLFIQQAALKKTIELNAVVPDDLPWIAADERRLRQVIVNLLSNAVKFTPPGGTICLEVQFDINTNLIMIQIRDTGIGIAPQDMDKLFKSFSQIDSSLSRQHEGTGLGLALVKRITELHGGCVEVQSTVGQGSCFTVKLPCRLMTVASPVALAESEIAPSLPVKPQRQIHPFLILLAEDNEMNVMTIASYLTAVGYQLIIAHNGIEALEQAKTHHPDLILMDIQMPQMDGLEATRRLRADTDLAHIPLIALTALAMAGDRERCLEAGANEYLSKPVNLQDLVTLIQQYQ